MKALERYTPIIQDLYPLKAQFRSGERIRLAVELAHAGDEPVTATLRCSIWELHQEVEQQTMEGVVIPPHTVLTVYVEAGPFHTAFTGYGAEVVTVGAAGQTHAASTAFDVVEDWRVAPRYGFLSDFGVQEAGDEKDVKWMNKLHLNLVQFYDWMYRHDDLVSEEAAYVDLMGREVSRNVVEEKIRLCHDYGMRAVAYGAVYAASKAFAEAHPDWRLYTSAGDPYDFIGIFSIMNIAEDSPWHRHIVHEYRRAVELLDFDGIHMDTYGFPKTGWSDVNGEHRLERLETQLPVLIESTRDELTKVKDDVALILNNVGNWPVDTVARSSQDAIYVEVWKPYERYHHLAEIIRTAKLLSGGKPVILAAYLKPFRELGPLGEEGAEHAFRLMNAVVTANRAYHLLHGEAAGVLTQGYYVDHSRLRPGFMSVVRDYADFGVRYGHVIYDQKLRDVSMTHADGDNLEYQFTGFPYSTYGESGKVWTIMMESERRKVIHFVNLSSAGDDYWNEAKAAPQPVGGRCVTVAFDGELESILLASPDTEHGRPTELECRVEFTSRGKAAVLELPELHYWDMVIMNIRL